jgi:RNA polymerase sigma factor (sigma-70 family)
LLKKVQNYHENINELQEFNGQVITHLFEEYEQLLAATARRYGSGGYYLDAYQEACAAFMKVILEWQPDLGVPFPAFAKAKVRGDVRTAMRRIWRYEDRRLLSGGRGDEDADAVNELWDVAGSGVSVHSGYGTGTGAVIGTGTGVGVEAGSGTGAGMGSRVEYQTGQGLGQSQLRNTEFIDLSLDIAKLIEQAGLSQRERLYLKWLMEGRPLKEMAAIAHVSVETVKTWRKRAMHKLRSKIEFLLEDDE